MTDLATILERLRAKPSGKGWAARCPAHEDKRASLFIGRNGRTGAPTFYCFAGCSYEAICAALGIDARNAPECPTRPERVPTHTKTLPDLDAALWWAVARSATAPDAIRGWAMRLGLPPDTLDYLGAATHGNFVIFPMRDGEGNIIGIRTRAPDGAKMAVKGSRAGVCVPTVRLEQPVLVCEGQTDAAAAMALCYEPIARPSCSGQEDYVVATVKRWGMDRATVCADADGPGAAGARKLIAAMRAARLQVRAVHAWGHKDLRAWYQSGATREDVEAAWGAAKWR